MSRCPAEFVGTVFFLLVVSVCVLRVLCLCREDFRRSAGYRHVLHGVFDLKITIVISPF